VKGFFKISFGFCYSEEENPTKIKGEEKLLGIPGLIRTQII
jgi:hypothetical protein